MTGFIQQIVSIFGRFFGKASQRQSFGHLGEEAAQRFLRQKGYQVLDTNYRISGGEIDIIAEKDHVIAFIEVKTLRRTDRRPQDAVVRRKQKKIIRTARQYLIRYGLTKTKHRFDIIAICWPEGGEPEIEHYTNAFSPGRFSR